MLAQLAIYLSKDREMSKSHKNVDHREESGHLSNLEECCSELQHVGSEVYTLSGEICEAVSGATSACPACNLGIVTGGCSLMSVSLKKKSC